MSKYLLKTFSLLFIITLVIRFIDVVKNLYVASKIGVSDVSDIYLALIVIPDSLIVLIGFDTIRGVINSEFSGIKDINTSDEAKQSFKSIFTFLLLSSFLILIMLLVFNDQILSLLLPGFSNEKRFIALQMTYIIFPIFFLKSIIALFHSYYNSLNKFYFPVITQALVTFSIIVFIFMPVINNQFIFNLSYGILIGTFLYLVFLFVPIVKLFGLDLFSFKINPLTRKIFKNCLSLLVFVIINQIYLFSKNFIVSYFPNGNLSALNYAVSVTTFISALTFNTVFSPLLSSFAQNFSFGRKIVAKTNFANTILGLVFVYISIILVFVIFSKEILSLLYMRGKFTLEGVELTSKPFIWESLALFPFIFSIISTALFLAKKEYKKLTIIGVIVYSFGIIMNLVLTYYIDFFGISISSFLVYLLQSILLLYFAQKFLGRFNHYYKKLSLLLMAGILTFFIMYLIKINLFVGVYYNFYSLAVYLLAGIISVNLIYFSLTYFFKVNLIFDLKKILFSTKNEV